MSPMIENYPLPFLRPFFLKKCRNLCSLWLGDQVKLVSLCLFDDCTSPGSWQRIFSPPNTKMWLFQWLVILLLLKLHRYYLSCNNYQQKNILLLVLMLTIPWQSTLNFGVRFAFSEVSQQKKKRWHILRIVTRLQHSIFYERKEFPSFSHQ